MGGLLYAAAAGLQYHRGIAYGLYIAAAVVLVLAPLAGTRTVYRRTSLPLVQPSAFVAAAIALCVVGAVIDVAFD
ncbi:MAG TPA: hypothetical protein VFL60_10920 [Gaiellaceae bacterium]|nr:hypothetical protein [Gaiellaceae bacterium]